MHRKEIYEGFQLDNIFSPPTQNYIQTLAISTDLWVYDYEQ